MKVPGDADDDEDAYYKIEDEDEEEDYKIKDEDNDNDEDADYKIDALFCKLFLSSAREWRPSFSPHLHRHYTDNRILYPDPLFAAQKKLSCVSMLELPHPSSMIMVGRPMKPSSFYKHLFNLNLSTTRVRY